MIPPPFVEFRAVAFGFGGARAEERPPVLADVTLEIHRGELFCLLGPSGCGKTTLLNILAGFERPNRGGVLMAGRPIEGPGVDRSVVFQGDDSLFPWLTAAENVEFGLRMGGMPRDERRRVASEALRLVGLADQGRKFPRELSGGMKQRIQIARALVCRSDVLLMDEPFAALDAQMRSLLQEELVSLWQKTGTTVLFITHDIGEALVLGSRIGLMTAGPGASLREIIRVDLPRPRRRGDPAFGGYYDRINRVVVEEVHRALRQSEAGKP